ncbi:hypothetical protein C5C50_04265 [Rathayibacter sp. AY1D9]|nr:hypothetical protein C5C50_04265 [Rathayibacter sp. AY1D9]
MTGTAFKVSPGDGQLFAPNMPVTLAPYGKDPSYDNAEIARITSVSCDSLVLERGTEGSIPKIVQVGWVIAGTVTAGTLEAIEDAVLTKADQTYVDELVDGLDLRGDVRTVAGRTGNVVLSKADVGLNLVDNTSDAAKPVSAPVQTALNAKYNASNPAGYVDAFQAAASAPVQTVAGRQGAVTLAKGDVGLGNVDNTSDASKPVSVATSSALALKAPLASPAFTGTPTGITKAHVGLGSVDNTSDAAKPVSTAQATAIEVRRTVTRTVDSAGADVIVTGAADQTPVNAAIAALSSTGGEVLVRRTLYLTAPIVVNVSNVKLRLMTGARIIAATSFSGGLIELNGQVGGLVNVVIEGDQQSLDCGGFANVQAIVIKGGTYSPTTFVDNVLIRGLKFTNGGTNAGNVGHVTVYSGRSITGGQDRGAVANLTFREVDFGGASKYHVFVQGNSVRGLYFYSCRFHDGLTPFSFGWNQPAKRNDSLSGVRSNRDLLFHECEWFSMNSSSVTGFTINDVARTGWRNMRFVGGRAQGHGIDFSSAPIPANQEFFANVHSALNLQFMGFSWVDVKTIFSIGQSNNGNYYQADPTVALQIKNCFMYHCYNFMDEDAAIAVDIDGLYVYEMYLNLNLGYSRHSPTRLRNAFIYNPVVKLTAAPEVASIETAAIYLTPDNHEISNVIIKDDRLLPNPTLAPVLSAVTLSGAPGGTFFFAYSWTNDTGETVISSLSSLTVASGQTVKVTHPYSSTYSPPSGAKHVRIYGRLTSSVTAQDTIPVPWHLEYESDVATTGAALNWNLPLSGLVAGVDAPLANTTTTRVKAGIWEVSGGNTTGIASRYFSNAFYGIAGAKEIVEVAGYSRKRWDNISNPTLIAGDDVFLDFDYNSPTFKGAIATAVAARSAATTLDATHCSVELNTTATQTLPALATCQGRMYEFVNINAAAATIKGNGSELIGNVTTANTYTLPSGATVTLKAFPSAWRVV